MVVVQSFEGMASGRVQIPSGHHRSNARGFRLNSPVWISQNALAGPTWVFSPVSQQHRCKSPRRSRRGLPLDMQAMKITYPQMRLSWTIKVGRRMCVLDML